MTRARVLVVEDDEAILTALDEKLALEGFRVDTARDGEAARRLLHEERFDIVLLDIMLPQLDGLEVLRWLRRTDADLPVLIISARGAELEKVAGLRAGADDYLTKPFGLAELLARIDALLRRAKGFGRSFSAGEIRIDTRERKVFRRGREVPLSRKESDVVFYLLEHRERTVSREELLDRVWGYDVASTARAIDYHVLNLRRKLEQDPHEPSIIVTHHGVGYRLVVEDEQSR